MLTRQEIVKRYLAKKNGEYVPPVHRGRAFGYKASSEEIAKNTGPNNCNWKGGTRLSIRRNGLVYREILVGKNHHLANKHTGYAYEHRVVAEQKLGRRLLPEEIVHHNDGNGLNNDPENLTVVNSQLSHFVYHRKKSDLQYPGENNELIICKCGCGSFFSLFDKWGRKREFITGHNTKLRYRAPDGN